MSAHKAKVSFRSLQIGHKMEPFAWFCVFNPEGKADSRFPSPVHWMGWGRESFTLFQVFLFLLIFFLLLECISLSSQCNFEVLGWPKDSFGIFHHELFDQPNTQTEVFSSSQRSQCKADDFSMGISPCSPSLVLIACYHVTLLPWINLCVICLQVLLLHILRERNVK